MELVCSSVTGEMVNLIENNLQPCIEHELRKIYKIKDEELKIGSLLDAVINRISTKELVTF